MATAQDGPAPPTVSVICPTRDRSEMLPHLYEVFSRQTYPYKELLVLDDGPSPSAFMLGLSDGRVRYFHQQGRMSIGEKRNVLVGKASGEIIAHFDDDDIYADTYLEYMLARMGQGAFVKLSAWFLLHVPSNQFFYWDASAVHPTHYRLDGAKEPFVIQTGGRRLGDDWLRRQLWGYGFSYMYRRSLHAAGPFDTIDKGEDYAFACRAVDSGAPLTLVPPDTHGAVIHVVHGRNISASFPNSKVPASVIESLFQCEWPRWLQLVAPTSTPK